jgi:hypothetical protein
MEEGGWAEKPISHYQNLCNESTGCQQNEKGGTKYRLTINLRIASVQGLK